MRGGNGGESVVLGGWGGSLVAGLGERGDGLGEGRVDYGEERRKRKEKPRWG